MVRGKSFSYQVLEQLLLWLLLLLLGSSGNAVAENEALLQTYIIHMDHSQKPASFLTHESWHQSTLNSLSNPVDDKEMMLYSYNHVLHGFSARLTPSQLSEIEKSPAHIATHKESFGKLFTTYSPKFLGLNHKHGLWPSSSYGEGVIIGMVDSGIWPESESFRDDGMPSVPKRWKGLCENGTTSIPFKCNRKIIGGRVFIKAISGAAGGKLPPEYFPDSARDFESHGTHTSSTAAGNFVEGASYFGYARGTASGVAPAAYIAMYKVVAEDIASADVLAAMDQAIADGVDIISLSLGFDQKPYFDDVIAIASLSAMEKGISVVCAAGNDERKGTTHNAAPWITTVGAGTVDRSFTATMTLGNGLTVEGTSYFPASVYLTHAPLYYDKATNNFAVCGSNALNHSEVKRKVVLCDGTKADVYAQMQELRRVGAYAGVILTDNTELEPEDYAIPSLVLPTALRPLIIRYLTQAQASANVTSIKFESTNFGIKPAPQVADFSSRGPDPINPGVLKPDIIAPGVDIVAAIPNRPFVDMFRFKLITDFAFESGTSMAAPHVSGLTALLKSAHPEWSPAAIQSAIMTTAYTLDSTGTILKDQRTGLPSTPLDFGAGYINPNKALDPGLIYDINVQDYIDFLCSLNYTEKQMRSVLRRNQWNCSHGPADLNYPSFTVLITNGSGSSTMKNFNRAVTNVGNDAAIYKASLETPAGMRIKVEPSTVKFTYKYQKQNFVLSVEVDQDAPVLVYGFLRWTDEHNHVVSSPIVAIRL